MTGKDEKSPLDGVTVDGVSVEEWLGKKRVSEKTLEIERERRAAERMSRGRHRPYMPKTKEGGPRVARRVVHLTDRQIRKEYGIMQKPFETKAENTLWLIFEQGPVTSRDIMAALPSPTQLNSLTALLASLWKTLGDSGARIIDRERRNGVYFYSKKPGVDVSVESAAEKYRAALRRERIELKASQEIDALPSQDRPEPDQIEEPRPEPPTGKPVADLLSTACRNYGLNVTFGGRVEIVFRFKIGD
jgi:hypothetical protein